MIRLIAIVVTALLVAGCSGWRDQAHSITVANATNETATLAVKISKDGVTRYERTFALDPGKDAGDRLFADTGSFEFSAQGRHNLTRALTLEGPRGIIVRITDAELAISLLHGD